MPTKVERSIEISRPPDEVFDYLCDIDRLQDWATTVVQTRDVPAGAISAGASFTQSIRVAGRSVETQGRVTEFERPRRIASEATAPGGGRLVMREIVEPSGRGSRVTLDFEYDVPGGFLGKALNELHLERRSAREAEHSLQNLKDILEGGPATHV